MESAFSLLYSPTRLVLGEYCYYSKSDIDALAASMNGRWRIFTQYPDDDGNDDLLLQSLQIHIH